MSIAYTTMTGGGVSIKEAYVVAERRLLDGALRRDIRARLRQRVIAALEEQTGLPFDLAVTNITAWHETEWTHREWETFGMATEEQPVVLLTECRVRRVEYPEEAR